MQWFHQIVKLSSFFIFLNSLSLHHTCIYICILSSNFNEGLFSQRRLQSNNWREIINDFNTASLKNYINPFVIHLLFLVISAMKIVILFIISVTTTTFYIYLSSARSIFDLHHWLKCLLLISGLTNTAVQDLHWIH